MYASPQQPQQQQQQQQQQLHPAAVQQPQQQQHSWQQVKQEKDRLESLRAEILRREPVEPARWNINYFITFYVYFFARE
jgi:hypothetical protein